MNFHSSEKITSLKNPRVQFIRSLLTNKTSRSENELFVTEGIRLAEEVLNSGFVPDSVFFTDQISERTRELVKRCSEMYVNGFEMSSDVMDKISDTETSQGILLVVPQKVVPIPKQSTLVLILDQLRDPGNCGTILRTAAAAGVDLVFSTPGSADLFMPKVVRAGMGAHFRLCIRQSDWKGIVDYCKQINEASLKIMLAESSSGSSLWQIDLKDPLALVIGGEAEGASPEARAAADSLVHIPMPGKFESLNAGVAASILLFEIVRQRTL